MKKPTNTTAISVRTPRKAKKKAQKLSLGSLLIPAKTPAPQQQ